MANCIRCGRQLPGFSFGKKICQWCVRHEAYQRGELADDAPQPVMAAPWVRRESSVGLTQVILGINVAVFLGMVIASGNPAAFGNPMQEFSTPESLRWGANAGLLTFSGEWWRPSVGASGAIFGLAGALIAAFKLGEFSVPRAALAGTLRSLGAFVVYNLIFGFAMPGIDNTAHIGGLVTGLIVGALIAVVAPYHDRPLRRVAVFLVMTIVLAGVAVGSARHYGFPLRIGRTHLGQADSVPESDSTQAITHLQKIVQQRPDFVPAQLALAQAYFSQADYGQAETELKHVLQLQPEHADARILLGMVYLNQNRPQDAKDTFTRLLTQDANNADGHFGLGLALAAEQNHQAAIEEYKTALRLDPQISGVNYNLGVSYAKLDQYDDAIAAFLKEREQSGDTYDIETALASAYQAKGLTGQAEEARNKAKQLKDR